MNTKLFIDFKTNTKKKVDIDKSIIIKKNNLDIPWIEKYRPKNIHNMILNQVTKNKIKKMIEEKNMPNIIITGYPGTGKTSTILCIAKEILGKFYKEGVIELNASDNRGLDIMNNTIIHFCKKKLKHESIKHKIIILDEADNITKKAQNVLSNYIEQYNHNTRFALTCNDSSQIIESIQSRCIILRYTRLSNEKVKKAIINICEKEEIIYSEKGIDMIVFLAQGDIRTAINILESTYNGYGKIKKKYILKICDQPEPVVITSIINYCLIGDLKKALENIEILKGKGYCNNDIVLTMINILKDISITKKIKMEYIKIASETYMNINDGIDSSLQLYGCIAKMTELAV